MRRLAVRAASALLAASLLAGPALAGDAASFNPLGFSADGRYFAFEEFGIQDGSGFPYANLTILDMDADAWVGTPIRIQLDADGATLAQARSDALAQAGPQLDKLAIDTPATIVALIGDGAPGSDGSMLEFGMPGYGMDPPHDVATLRLSTNSPAYAGPCVADYGFEAPLGYELSLEAPSGNAVLHIDESVPASRGCAVGYRIHGVFAPFEWAGRNLQPVAVLSVFTHGFEGPDRRFLAVPITGYP